MFTALKRLLVWVEPKAPLRARRTDDADLGELLKQPLNDGKSLSAEAKKWLVSLPEGVWPKLICVRKPSVANDLADLWKVSLRFNEYVDDLMDQIDPADMPPTYREELARLTAYRSSALTEEAEAVGERRAQPRRH